MASASQLRTLNRLRAEALGDFAVHKKNPVEISRCQLERLRITYEAEPQDEGSQLQ
jgi:ABC-type proline/glycine betaine transport system ATPase subunit